MLIPKKKSVRGRRIGVNEIGSETPHYQEYVKSWDMWILWHIYAYANVCSFVGDSSASTI